MYCSLQLLFRSMQGKHKLWVECSLSSVRTAAFSCHDCFQKSISLIRNQSVTCVATVCWMTVHTCASEHACVYVQCRKMVELRQRLMAQDVRVEHSFYSKCEDDIKKFSCLGGTAGHEDAKRAHVLLCLESAHMDGELSMITLLCYDVYMFVWYHVCTCFQVSDYMSSYCA